MSRTIHDLDLGTHIWINENGTAQEYYVLHHYDDSAVVLRAQAVTTKQINTVSTATYANKVADTWLENETNGFMSYFDEATKKCFVSRPVDVYNYGDSQVTYIARRCFLLSYKEAFDSGRPSAGISYVSALEAATGLTGDSARICYNSSNSTVSWWLRSPDYTSNMYRVNANGDWYSNSASNSSWLRPAFFVASATIVSDEGTDKIQLLPEASTVTPTVAATVVVGETTNRPALARVDYTSQNLNNVSVQISNNFGDDDPVWVDAVNGQDTALENTTKTTDKWQIGLKLYGESDGRGYFEEPIVLIKEETE